MKQAQSINIHSRERTRLFLSLVVLGILFGNASAPLDAQSLFASAQTYNSGGSSWAVAVADVNGDGKPDVVALNNNNNVGILLGNGDGTFQPIVTYSYGGQNPVSLALADVNGDGKLDLVIANAINSSGNGTISVLLGNGDGTFQSPVTYNSGGEGAYWVEVGDVNGDGKPDIVVSNLCSSSTTCAAGSTVGVLLNNGDGTFSAAVTYGSGGFSGYRLTVADVNGDGKLDIVSVNECGSTSACTLDGTIGVLLGNGDGTFRTAVTYDAGGRDTYSAAVGDLNGDGKPDVVVTNYCLISSSGTCSGDGSVGVLLGNGDGTFQAASTTDSGGWDAWPVALADVNGDGKMDVLVTNECGSGSSCTSGTAAALLGNGDGTLQTATTYPSGGSQVICLAVADVNGDGRPDLVVGNAASSTIGVLLNISVGQTTTIVGSATNPSYSGQTVTFTATVSSKSFKAKPTGVVTFKDGSVTLGTGTLNASAVATYTTSSLALGLHSITASYGGDANNASSTSAALSQNVNPADFVVSSNPPSTSVTAGQPAMFTVNVTPQGSFTTAIAFSCSGLPGLASCAFNPATVTPNSSLASTTLTISTAAHTASLAAPTLGRPAGPLYAIWLIFPTLLLATAGLAAPRNKVRSYTLACMLVAGCLFQGACSSGSGGKGGGTGGTPSGTYSVIVTGTAGSVQHSTTIQLTVQ